MPLTVALLHYSAPPIVGGVESVLGWHARLLADAGHSVRVLAGRGAAEDARVAFHAVPLADSRHPEILAAKAELDQGRVPANFPALVRALSADLRAQLAGCDVLIAHNVASLHKNLALTAALQALCAEPGAPRMILWHHDLAWCAPRYQAELHPGYPWDLLRTSWGARHVVISALRQHELATLLGCAPESIPIVPNGVVVEEFLKLEAQTRDLLTRTDLLAAAPILLLPVRITPRKNIELALRVLAQLRRTAPAAALVVTGPPGAHNPTNSGYFDRLKALRAELDLTTAAHFLIEHTESALPSSVVADLYRVADALFLPSFEEGFGIPLLEAGLTRLPIFCSALAPLQALGQQDAVYFAPDAAPEAVATLLAEHLAQMASYRFAVRTRTEFTWAAVYQRAIAPLLEA